MVTAFILDKNGSKLILQQKKQNGVGATLSIYLCSATNHSFTNIFLFVVSDCGEDDSESQMSSLLSLCFNLSFSKLDCQVCLFSCNSSQEAHNNSFFVCVCVRARAIMIMRNSNSFRKASQTVRIRSMSNAKKANLCATRKERIKLLDSEIGDFGEFLNHPSGILALLNTDALQSFQFLDANTYRFSPFTTTLL